MDNELTALDNGYIKLGLKYVKTWNSNAAGQEMMMQMIKTNSTVQNILCTCYAVMVTHKIIIAIDQMPVDLLDDIENEAQAWVPGIEGRDAMKLMKSIWAMNNMIEICSKK